MSEQWDRKCEDCGAEVCGPKEHMSQSTKGCWNCLKCKDCCDCDTLDECEGCGREYPRGDSLICGNCNQCFEHCCFLCDDCQPYEVMKCECDGSNHKKKSA